MATTPGSGEMRVGQLARRASATTGTINFYVQQGLLPPPRKVNRTRAYYDERHVQRLSIIRRLQAVHGMSLAMIKRVLEQAGHDDQLLHRLANQRGPAFALHLAQMPARAPLDAPSITAEELRTRSGLTAEQLQQVEALGLLQTRGERKLYGAPELEAATALQVLMDLGAGE